MRFRFCGDVDCPDWVLAEIATLSRLSSVKLKLLGHVVTNGILNPPINMEKATKLFADSKLDADVDLKACVACLTFILTSAVRHNCDSNALNSELQQLGLPREHSLSVRKVFDDQMSDLAVKFRLMSMRVKRLENVEATSSVISLTIDGRKSDVVILPETLDQMLGEMKKARTNMQSLKDADY